MKKLLTIIGAVAVLMMLAFSMAYAETGDVTITFWGQSAFKLESGGVTILIDPWITGNWVSPVTADSITKADYILVTHDHFDHVGDTIALSKKTGAIVIAEYETAQKLIGLGLPPQNVLFGGFGRGIGGAIDIGGISLVMTTAVHSSDSGVAVGYILKFPGGATVYHAGDTAIFSDMQIYGALYPMDMALLPIGGAFTMDAVQAAESLRLLRPGKVIPMHYGTFPMLAPNADQFVAQAKKVAPEVRVIVLQPGESRVLQPKTIIQ
jgi:L-ascorbate metabolism protein UlaG (beta-lactamase superfamily)